MLTVTQAEALMTDAAVTEYWERGYWISPPFLDEAEITQLRQEVTRMRQGDYDRTIPSMYNLEVLPLESPKISQNLNSFWLNDAIRAVVTSPALGMMAARLMQVPTVRLWHDQAIYKPGVGTNGETAGNSVGWHQDYGFWKASSTTNMVTAWIALQDTDLSNGGMRTIVGSHRWGLIEGSDTFHSDDLEGLAKRYAAEGKGEWLDEPCILKAGQISFHHALTFHGSGPNRSDQARLSLVAHLMPGNTVYAVTGNQYHPNLTLLGPNAYDGQPFMGDYWPQLWPVNADA